MPTLELPVPPEAVRHHPPVAIIDYYWRRMLEKIDEANDDPVAVERWKEYILARGLHWYD